MQQSIQFVWQLKHKGHWENTDCSAKYAVDKKWIEYDHFPKYVGKLIEKRAPNIFYSLLVYHDNNRTSISLLSGSSSAVWTDQREEDFIRGKDSANFCFSAGLKDKQKRKSLVKASEFPIIESFESHIWNQYNNWHHLNLARFSI